MRSAPEKARAVATLALLALLPAGCAVNPVSGRPEVVLISAKQEQKIGLEESEKVETSMGLVEDADLLAFVGGIGARLTQHSPRRDVEYRFQVVNTPEPNAFALPGGFVYVSRGLLALVNSEDELAGVIGHEIGHVAARHSVSRSTLATPFALAAALPGALVGIVSPTLGKVVSAPGALAGGLVLAPYSRGQENEADRIGVELAGKAGWNPAALSHFLRTLEREETLKRGESRRPRFFDSHPSTPKRVSATAQLASAMPRGEQPPVSSPGSGLLDVLEGLTLGEDPAHGVFLESRFLHPDLGFRLAFPKGWVTHNSPQVVAAASGSGDAVAMLHIVAEGEDPLSAASKVAGKDGLRWVEEPRAAEVRGRSAARAVGDARTSRGPVRLDLAWVELDGRVYQLTGMADRKAFDGIRPLFTGFIEGFGSLGARERAEIRETRLRTVRARPGESLAALVERTGSTWEVAEVAVANSLDEEVRLTSGQRIKIAVEEAYRGGGG